MESTMKAKVTVGNVTVDVGQVIRNLKGVETEEDKKSFLQRVLEPQEVDDSERDAKKAEKIARKIARGETVTPQEKAFLMKTDPKLAQMAELARQQGERIKHALQNASTKSEQQNIIHQAYDMVAQVSKKQPQFGELLGEAVKAAVQDSKKKGVLREEADEVPGERTQGGEEESLQQEVFPERAMSKKDEQQILLEQFLPEECASIMDCRG